MRATARHCVVLAVLSLGLLAGCGGGGSSSAGTQANTAAYRVFNASPDTPSLNILVNGAVRVPGLTYGSATLDFLRVAPETYDIGLRPSGDAIDAWTEAVQLASGESDLLVAVGLQSFGEEFEKRLRLSALKVDRSAPNGNKSRLIVLNGFVRAPGFDQVGVDFKNPGDNPQTSFSDIPFAEAQSLDLDSGPQAFEFRLAGAEEVQSSGTLNLEAGKIYLVILQGIEGASGAQSPEMKLFTIQAK